MMYGFWFFLLIVALMVQAATRTSRFDWAYFSFEVALFAVVFGFFWGLAYLIGRTFGRIPSPNWMGAISLGLVVLSMIGRE